MDQRNKILAKNLINYSIRLQPQEKLLIEVFDDAVPLAAALLEEAYKINALPFISVKNNCLHRALLRQSTIEQMQLIGDCERYRMEKMDAYIGIRGSANISELSDVSADKMHLYEKYWSQPVHTNLRVPHTKWCVLRYPNASMAQLANMSTEAFTDFYFNVCNLDYAKMSQAMTPLCELMESTDKVTIKGPGTDLTFSINGIPTVKCSGLCNIPDGEVYTAPVMNSVHGRLTYNVPSVCQGITYENIVLEFEHGKIINATANHTDSINKVLDTDKGARYIGEFSLGLNPYIKQPMKDILFDEKISGSFHFTPGNAYDKADNGNDSAIHWDLVCIQTPAAGGGEIYFDDLLIRKDGRFTIPSLQGLNPENLK